MSIFLSLLVKLTPLYMNIGLGYLAGKWLQVNRDSIMRMMFFMINPLIIFNGVIHTTINRDVLALPVLTFMMASGLCISFYRISRHIWQDSTKNLVAFSAGTGNTGYFGLPLALILFNDQTEGVYIMALLGISLYENSLGYYISGKDTHTPKECLIKLLKLPTLYAYLLGLSLNLAHVPVPTIFSDFMGHIKGAYTVLGMMIIGLGISSLRNFQIDLKFIGMTFLAKFLAWPILVLTLITLDSTIFHMYNTEAYQALILISLVPMAVNTVIISSLMNCFPEKASAAVLLSTIFAILYIPFIVQFL